MILGRLKLARGNIAFDKIMAVAKLKVSNEAEEKRED